MTSAIDKCKKLMELRKANNYNYLISVDGGINDKTLPQISEYLDLAVSGSYVCNAENKKERLEILHKM